MDFIVYKKPTSRDNMVDDFLLCDYLEEDSIIKYEDEDQEKENEKQESELNEEIEDQEPDFAEQEDIEPPKYEREEYYLEEEEEEEDTIEEMEEQYIEKKEEDTIEEMEEQYIERKEETSDDSDSITEEDDEIEFQLEEYKKLIIQIEDKIHTLETNNSNMITSSFFINREKYTANMDEISIFKNKKKEYEKNMEFIYNLLLN